MSKTKITKNETTNHLHTGTTNTNYDFSSLLWRTVAVMSPETEIVSPFGFGLIMAMVKLGSTGKSESEIQNALHFSREISLGEHYRHILKSYDELVKRNVHVLVVSSMIDKMQSAFRQDFIRYARDHFRVTCSNWNYSNGNGVVQAVNKRFAKASKDILIDILKRGDIHLHTQMVLLNGVYFQGLFEKQCRFKANNTTKEPFYNLNGTTVKVYMMSGSSNFLYARLEDLKCSAIGIPYDATLHEGRFTFVVVLPDAKRGISELNTKMDAQFFQNVRDKLKSQSFYAKLPRFSATSRINFVPVMQALGIKAMFKDPPDFHGFFQHGWARHFSKFIQENVLDISEKGSICPKAFAALQKAELLPGQIKFRADHPFLFFVMDDTRDMVIFVGCKSQF